MFERVCRECFSFYQSKFPETERGMMLCRLTLDKLAYLKVINNTLARTVEAMECKIKSLARRLPLCEPTLEEKELLLTNAHLLSGHHRLVAMLVKVCVCVCVCLSLSLSLCFSLVSLVSLVCLLGLWPSVLGSKR